MSLLGTNESIEAGISRHPGGAERISAPTNSANGHNRHVDNERRKELYS